METNAVVTNAVSQVSLGLNQIPWLRRELWGNPLWAYLTLVVYILAALFIAKLVDVLVTRELRRLLKRSRTFLDEKIIRLLHRPLWLTVFLILLHSGLRPFHKPGWMEEYLGVFFGALVAVVVTYVILRFVDIGFEVTHERLHRNDPKAQQQVMVLLRKTIKVFVIAVAALVAADNMGMKVGGALASVGLTGLAVALAAQETLANFIGSLVLLADRPFIVGDRVKIGTDEGVVEHMGLRSTCLRTKDGDAIIIPNKNVVSSSILNYSNVSPAPPAPPQPPAG